jgi:hypothetical protein
MSNINLCADGNIKLCADGRIKLGCNGCVYSTFPTSYSVAVAAGSGAYSGTAYRWASMTITVTLSSYTDNVVAIWNHAFNLAYEKQTIFGWTAMSDGAFSIQHSCGSPGEAHLIFATPSATITIGDLFSVASPPGTYDDGSVVS